jgi:hypothetical protein
MNKPKAIDQSNNICTIQKKNKKINIEESILMEKWFYYLVSIEYELLT